MAADSDGCNLTTVITCEGDLSDPLFAARFESVVYKLNGILCEVVKVHKLEPWNSVRVTLSIPREAALRLRKLASEGSAQLRALGILSVQVEGDQVISLRIASSTNAEPQEIRLQTTQDGSRSSQADGVLSRFLGAPTEPEKVQFKSPNVVCPPDSVVPKVPTPSTNTSSTTPPTTKAPFPFTSMNQAIHSQSNYVAPPPPYPGNKHPAVTISSPLLVNLLQNDGAAPSKTTTESTANSSTTSNITSAVKVNSTLVQKQIPSRTIVSTRTVNTKLPQAGTSTLLSSTSSSLSALSNTSNNRQNNSTIPNVTLPPPPPYSVAVSRQWDSVVQTSAFMDLTPSLDLKTDLEHLIPTLERDLARSPPEIPEELTHSDDKRNFLINPLTGELEPQSSGESESEGLNDVFTGLPSPAAISDEDTSSTIRPDTTDQSDSETRSSSHSDSGKHSRKSKTSRDRGRDSPVVTKPEKIKLRLKLEKSEPVNSAYKVDVSFIQQPKKASTSVMGVASPVGTLPTSEELRVPPLHISLRGRHHAFITNKKKKIGTDKVKVRKTQDPSKVKKVVVDGNSAISINEDEEKKMKKFKSNHGHESELVSKLIIHNSAHFKDKQKERRGSDSELSRANMKFVDHNGLLSIEKKRRLSQSSEPSLDILEPTILGSTNVGTIASLPQKPRKDKTKSKDMFKIKDSIRLASKSFSKNLSGDKFSKQVTLPTGEIDMEAKFKQRLMEGTEKGIPRPPHRTDGVMIGREITMDNGQVIEKPDQIIKVESEPPPLQQQKSPEELDKCCNTPDRKQASDLTDKQSSRSPNSGAQGEDSGIESMDALSEKSPNQASQSPHDADIPETPAPSVTTTVPTITTTSPAKSTDVLSDVKSKTQVPELIPDDILDIEAQLAKMEGLNGVEDHNENMNSGVKKEMAQCCELTTTLQGIGGGKSGQIQQTTEAVPLKVKTKEEQDPLPVRVTPPLYTYSNTEKGNRADSESPTLSEVEEEDDNSNNSQPIVTNNVHNSTTTVTPVNNSINPANNSKTKSLLEQLLIEIPSDNQSVAPSSPSPATRSSVRTRALSKLNSPDSSSNLNLNSPKPTKIPTITTAPTKRKRHESDSFNSADEVLRNKKTRKCSENAAELIKACMGVDVSKINNVKKSQVTTTTGIVGTKMHLQTAAQDESSDSDEPLIEKVRKTSGVGVTTAVKKLKTGSGGLKAAMGTRRSVRTTTPATRSKGEGMVVKTVVEGEAIRRKTRSAVSEGDSKRKKEVK